MKRFEITVEGTSFDGHQVFACVADSELEARLKYSRSECEIIEHNVEVLGLGEVVCVEESDCIASRLPQDINSALTETNRLLNLECEELKKDIEAMKKAIDDLSERVVFPALALAKLDYPTVQKQPWT